MTLAWACLSSRLGSRVGPDQRPLVAHLLGRTLLLGAYHLVLLIPGA